MSRESYRDNCHRDWAGPHRGVDWTAGIEQIVRAGVNPETHALCHSLTENWRQVRKPKLDTEDNWYYMMGYLAYDLNIGQDEIIFRRAATRTAAKKIIQACFDDAVPVAVEIATSHHPRSRTRTFGLRQAADGIHFYSNANYRCMSGFRGEITVDDITARMAFPTRDALRYPEFHDANITLVHATPEDFE